MNRQLTLSDVQSSSNKFLSRDEIENTLEINHTKKAIRERLRLFKDDIWNERWLCKYLKIKIFIVKF